MSDYEMEVIVKPEEGSATVLVHGKKGPYHFIQGEGHTNYLCGTCKNVLCSNVERGQIVGIVFKCPNCDSFNHIKGT